MVKTVVCPEVKVPEKVKSSINKQTEKWKQTKSEADQTLSKKEIASIFGEIKDLAATSFVGKSRLKHKEDILTKLGAAPVKQQKMPFKMRMGILEGKRKREAKIVSRAKESGVVLSTQKKTTEKKAAKKNRSRDVPKINIGTKGGILHLNRSNIPSHR